MCSYGSFAKMGGSGAGLLRSKGEQRKDRPRRLSTKEKRLGVSLRKADVAFVNACKGGLVDSVGDILAHQAGDARHVTSVNVVVRSGGRSQTNRLTTALHEAARGGHGNVCEVLLGAGADPRLTLELGRVLTALHVVTTPQAAQILLDGGAPSQYRQTLRSDSRVPDPAWYQRAQKRPAVAVVIDAFNEELLKRKGRRVAARARLQMIWQRLQGMVVGIRFIRKYQIAWKERFYDPENGAFMRGIGAERFAFYAGGGANSDSDRDEGDASEGGDAEAGTCTGDIDPSLSITSGNGGGGGGACRDGPETVAVEFAAGKGVAAVHAIRRKQRRRNEDLAATRVLPKASPPSLTDGPVNQCRLAENSEECHRLPPKRLAELKLAELKSHAFERLFGSSPNSKKFREVGTELVS